MCRHLNCRFPIHKASFLSRCFQYYSLSIWIWCICTWISLPFSRIQFAQLLESVGLYLSPTLGNLQPLFLQIYFSALQFFSSLSGIPRTQILDAQVLRALAIFFCLFCSLDNFYSSIFKFTNSSCYHLYSAIKFTQVIFKKFWLLYFSILKFWFGSFLS